MTGAIDRLREPDNPEDVMDRLTSLTVFVQVVSNGGFSAAARRLKMSPAMVTSHVQSLEDRLGVRLLNRTTRKVKLTEVGKVYYERMTQILAELEEADRIAGALQSTPRGTLRLHMNSHIAPFIAPVVTEFLALYPEVSIELAMGERMVDLIEEGMDLAIRTTLPADSSLIVRRLVTWRHVLCCAPDYLATHETPRQIADLTRHNCLRYAFYPFEEGWRFIGPDGKLASVPVSGNLLSASGEIIRAAALAGQGVWLAPGFMIADAFESGRLVPLLPAYRPTDMVMSAIYPHRHHLSAKVRGFIDLLARRIDKHRSWMDVDPRAEALPPATDRPDRAPVLARPVDSALKG
jgi:DNA-binding transcriptional LysR family regulator